MWAHTYDISRLLQETQNNQGKRFPFHEIIILGTRTNLKGTHGEAG